MYWKDLQDKSTTDLILYIQDREDMQRSKAAFIALTFRFNREIIDICRHIARKWKYDDDIADMIAERAFERFWKYPNGFQSGKCKSLDIDRCLVFYLLKTSRNCFFDYHNQEVGKTLSPYDGKEDVVVVFPDIEDLAIPDEKLENLRELQNKMEKALSRLSPKHQTIYLTYKAYEKEGYKLPRALLKKLREELSLSQSSIRVYKNEAFQSIDKLLNNKK